MRRFLWGITKNCSEILYQVVFNVQNSNVISVFFYKIKIRGLTIQNFWKFWFLCGFLNMFCFKRNLVSGGFVIFLSSLLMCIYVCSFMLLKQGCTELQTYVCMITGQPIENGFDMYVCRTFRLNRVQA